MPQPPSATPWSDVTALAAAAFPGLLAFNLPPSPTALNQALAFGLWGAWAAALAHELRRDRARAGAGVAAGAGRRVSTIAEKAAVAALLLLLVLAAASGLWGALPRSLTLSTLATLSAAGVLGYAGTYTAAAGAAQARRVFMAFCAAWLLAGWLHAVIALVQVFAPGLADGTWIAASALPGRAVGNLRQPNHVCTMLLWGLVACIALLQMGAMARRMAGLTIAVLAWALVLTASRTAILGVAAMALWGMRDRRLAPSVRAALIGSAAAYALAWAGMAAWTAAAHQTFGAAERFTTADVSASRFGIWRDTLGLVARHPWTGVGFGEFNFAWSLDAFPERPRAFFDHTHNLFLQWAVELGLPATVLLTAALVATVWPMLRAARRTPPDDGPSAVGGHGTPLRFGLAFLAVVALHSLLEYPLWYAYFLLPTAWIFGLMIGLSSAQPWPAENSGPDLGVKPAARVTADVAPSAAFRRSAPQAATALLLAGGLAMLLGAAAMVGDYARVAAIFDATSLRPLPTRLEDGKRSLFFAHHAHYAVATTSDDPREVLESARIAAHYLLDTRLMMAWADAWAASGDDARARHLAARLREFANPQARDYFSVCADGQSAVPGGPPMPAGPGGPPPAASPGAGHGRVPASSTQTPPAHEGVDANGRPRPSAAAVLPYQCDPASGATRLRWRDLATVVPR